MLFVSAVQLIDVVVEIFEDQVEFAADVKHLLEFYYVGVGQLPKGFNFPEFDALVPALVLLLELFDGHGLAGRGVGGLVDHSEVALAEGFDYLVFLHMEVYTTIA